MKNNRFAANIFICFTLLSLAAGCALRPPASSVERAEPLDPQDRLIIDEDVADARYVDIKGFEHMKLNRFMLERIEDYKTLTGFAEKKAFVKQFLEDAYALNDRVIVASVDKLTNEDISEFFEKAVDFEKEEGEEEEFDINVPGSTLREKFINAYRKHAKSEFQREQTVFLKLNSEASLDQYWQELVSNIEESIITKGRAMRLVTTAPLVPFVYAWIWYHAETDDRGPHVPEFADRSAFFPKVQEPQVDPAAIEDDTSLLQRYAPIIIQEKAVDPEYAPSIDRFGKVYLEGERLAEALPGVNTDKPSVYAYVDRKRIQGRMTRQLVYTLWYPEHPKLHVFDPEAGPMEGWTFRVTLNRDNAPVIYESVSNCGCYYKVFPTRRLEDRAMQEFREKEAGKTFYLEKKLPGKIDAVVPEIVDQSRAPTARPVLYYSAGAHQFVTVRPEPAMADAERRAPRETYQLLPYEQLENLPFDHHHASLFDKNGLVRKADRLECTLLKPSGIFHAGHPRQRRTQLIYFDQSEFDDSKLFEKYLRLPSRAFESKSH
jgi:hypothetical protein